MFDFQFYTLHGLLLEAERRGLTSFLRDDTGSVCYCTAANSLQVVTTW